MPTPNFLIVTLDDIGLEQFDRFGRGSTYANTPTINAWCDAGVIFTKAYAEQLCTPTRASLQAGVHPFGHLLGDLARGPLQADASTQRIGLSKPTIATMLNRYKTGYRTAQFGKFHLGSEFNGGLLSPRYLGFGHFVSQMFNLQTGGSNPENYYDWDKNTNGVVTRETEYGPMVVVRECIEWIKSASSRPFYAYLAPYSCHTPLNTPNVPPAGTYNAVSWPDAATIPAQNFKACTEAIDFYLARLAAELPASVWNNTIVLLHGDNGSPGPFVTDVDPLTGTSYSEINGHDVLTPNHFKDTPYDQAVHVPMLAYNAGSLIASPGRAVSNLVHIVDVMPTILEYLGITPNVTLHGKSLKGYLDNTSSAAIHPWVYSEHFLPNGASNDRDRTQNNWMTYDGRYVLLYDQDNNVPASPALFQFFDLDADPHQLTNLTPGGVTSGLSTAQAAARDAMLNGRTALVATA